MTTRAWASQTGLGILHSLGAGLIIAVASPALSAQGRPGDSKPASVDPTKQDPISKPGEVPQGPTAEYWDTVKSGDKIELVFLRGVRWPVGPAELRAERVVVTFDRDEYYRMTDGSGKAKDLPTRSMVTADPRRVLNDQLTVQRFEHFLQSLGNPGSGGSTRQYDMARLVRSIYLEGRVAVFERGTEVLTAKSLMFSVPDNRAVFENVLMRLVTTSSRGAEQVLLLRAPRLVKQGYRSTARNISLTTCNAGKPHFEIYSGQIEIIEREDEFEIITRDNSLAFSGQRTLPLPDAHFFTSEQSQLLIKGASMGYSAAEGTEVGVDLGSSMNQSGGAIHEFLTGRPASEFRGDWRLGITYNETRGFPLDGELSYRGGDLYEGQTHGFFLDNDGGKNRLFIRNDFGGKLITERDRSLINSETRFYLGESWTADLSLFAASDPSVYHEFYFEHINTAELPESSLHIRHDDENRLFTLTGRANLATFSYGDDRALAPAFREELPVATYDIYSERLFGVGDADVLLTSMSNAGWLHNQYDPTGPAPGKDNTFRFDQEVELAAPFHWGPLSIRPHSSARFTYYDHTFSNGPGTGSGGEYERWAFNAGISASTRLSKTFSWRDVDGNNHRLRHSMYPSVSFGHLYKVDGRPTDFYQFDEIDSLNEHGAIRVGLLNRFEKVVDRGEPQTQRSIASRADPSRGNRRGQDVFSRTSVRPGERREFLFLDVAQNFVPINDRDNRGEVLGLLEFEAIWRPYQDWIPLPNLRILIEGEHDWDLHELRTINTAVRFDDILGLDWGAGYRADYLQRGTLRYRVGTELLGRWTLYGAGAYDLTAKEQINYSVGMFRHDHDWIIKTSVVFDVISNETSFRVEFQPLFGGLFSPRTRDFAGLGGGTGPDAIMDY